MLGSSPTHGAHHDVIVEGEHTVVPLRREGRRAARRGPPRPSVKVIHHIIISPYDDVITNKLLCDALSIGAHSCLSPGHLDLFDTMVRSASAPPSAAFVWSLP